MLAEPANGCAFTLPARAVQGLETATDDVLAEVEVLELGVGLQRDGLDTDVGVPED